MYICYVLLKSKLQQPKIWGITAPPEVNVSLGEFLLPPFPVRSIPISRLGSSLVEMQSWSLRCNKSRKDMVSWRAGRHCVSYCFARYFAYVWWYIFQLPHDVSLVSFLYFLRYCLQYAPCTNAVVVILKVCIQAHSRHLGTVAIMWEFLKTMSPTWLGLNTQLTLWVLKIEFLQFPLTLETHSCRQ